MTTSTISEPFPIHQVAGRYLLHDADTVAHVRRSHNITGVLIGGLPQAPQQSVFLGLPVELTPEEARLLIDKGAGYLVDDTAQQKATFLDGGLQPEEARKFQALLAKSGAAAAETQTQRAEDRKDAALKKIGGGETQQATSTGKIGDGDMENWNDMPNGMLAPSRPRGAGRTKSRQRGLERSASTTPVPMPRSDTSRPPSGPPSAPPSGPPSRTHTPVGDSPPSPPISALGSSATKSDAILKGDELSSAPDVDRLDLSDPADADDETLFGGPTKENITSASRTSRATQPETRVAYGITPATSYPPLIAAPPSPPLLPPAVPSSYPLYRHMHDRGYFLAPGLRFGCQYTAYPGDPLRYHSHFLVNGKEWDEPLELMEIISGGRLGTGVKKGFLIGGVEPQSEAQTGSADTEVDGSNVRAFTVEWAGM